MPAAAILYDDDEIQVLRRPGKSAFTLVTFGGLTHRADGSHFWADEVAARLDIDVVGLMPKRENWYPATSMTRCASVVRGSLQHQAIGYGFSMGGYGALKYGRLLGLTHAFAVSPQFSIDPNDLPEEKRYHRFFLPELHAGMRVTAEDLPPFAIAAADPYDPPDQAHAALLTATGRLHGIRVPFTGHGAIWLFAQTEALRSVLGLITAEDVEGLRRFTRARRGQSAAWFRFVGRVALSHGHAALAERLWQKGRGLGIPADILRDERRLGLAELGRRQAKPFAGLEKAPVALAQLAAQWADKGRQADAAALLHAALEIDDTVPILYRSLAFHLTALGESEKARALYCRATLKFPDDPGLAIGLGHLLVAQRETVGAALAFRHAMLAAGTDKALFEKAQLGLNHTMAMLKQATEAQDSTHTIKAGRNRPISR